MRTLLSEYTPFSNAKCTVTEHHRQAQRMVACQTAEPTKFKNQDLIPETAGKETQLNNRVI